MRVSIGQAIRLLLAGALGAACAVLVACGSSGKGLIPSANAGPLSADFDAVAAAVSAGDCAATRRALSRAQSDFNRLAAAGVDSGLRQRISDGLSNLQSTAPTQCQQAQSQTSQSTTTTTPSTQTTSTQTTTAPPTTSSQTTTTQPPATTTTTSSTAITTPPPTTTGTGTGSGGGAQAPPGGGGGNGGAGAGGQ